MKINFLKKIYVLTKYHEYIFFSENISYFNSYKDFLLLLAKKYEDKKILHLVSDDEKKYKSLINDRNIITIGIGAGSLRTITFLLVKGKYFFMTLTNLGNYYLKRSINCKNYVYFFHSLASINKVYEHNAFKNYDIICCNGPYHKRELEEQEIFYNFRKKKLYQTGFIYLDYLKNKIDLNKEDKETILFAPSWNDQKNNLFDNYGLQIVKKLINHNYKVILRPHPEHFTRSINTINEILKNFENEKKFHLSKNLLDLESLEKSTILITDFSGIAIEFMAILNRQAILIEIGNKSFNKDWSDKNFTFEDDFKNNFGIKLNNQNEILDQLIKTINNKKSLKLDENKVTQYLKENLYNYGSVSNNLIKLFS